MRMSISRLFSGGMKSLFVIILVGLSTIPILWVFFSSFKTNAQILGSAFSLPTKLSLQNYITAFRVVPIAQFYVNSVIVAVCGTLINLTILGMAAYVLARFEFNGKNLLLLMFSLPLLIPASALLYPLYITMSKLGLYDHLLGLELVYAGLGMPVTLYILRSYFLTIPKELEEAAAIDGAGFLRTFTSVILPIARPGLATAAVLQFLLCWNEFQFAFILTTSTNKRTLPIAVSYFTSAYSANYGAMFAATILIILPSIFIYFLLQEQVISGMVSGSVKG
jgi:raffinose/stachyose/melibiose transport system permease protein